MAMAYVRRVRGWVYAGGMVRHTRDARIGIKAFDSEETAWRAAAKADGMDLSAWMRRAADRAMQSEERERKAREKWYG